MALELTSLSLPWQSKAVGRWRLRARLIQKPYSSRCHVWKLLNSFGTDGVELSYLTFTVSSQVFFILLWTSRFRVLYFYFQNLTSITTADLVLLYSPYGFCKLFFILLASVWCWPKSFRESLATCYKTNYPLLSFMFTF